MKTFLMTFLGGLLALLVFFVLLPLALITSAAANSGPKGPKGPVALTLDLREAQPDQRTESGLNSLLGGQNSFIETIIRLNAAADDPMVKGVYVRAAEAELGSARAEELRSAFQRIRAKGKFVISHSQGFVASGPAAYRAIAGTEIWMQPGSSFEVPGITFETLFLGRAFEKLNISADMLQFYEFKNAVDTYKQKGYTAPHAEAMRRLAESVWSDSAADIAIDRKAQLEAAKTRIGGGSSDPTDVALRARNSVAAALGDARKLLEASPFSSSEAIAVGFVDKAGWPEEAEAEAKKRAGGELLAVRDYVPPKRSGKAVIYVVGGEGEIVNGGGQGGLFDNNSTGFASDVMAAKLDAAAKDKSVSAVVFRIDSGGGSATASDQIWRAVKRVRDAGKPVVVSMGSAAASGGYYVAAGADAIVADKATITGSIGVFGGKFAIAGGLRMIGVDPAEVHVGGDYATAYSAELFTDAQRQALRRSLEDVYGRFTGLVAEGRKLPIEKVRELAKGRIWSGSDAKERGLVDETGGLMAAIEKARVLAKAPADGYQIRLHTPSPSPLQALAGLMSSGSADAKAEAARASLETAASAVVGERRAAALLRDMHVLSARQAQLAIPTIIEH